VTVVADGRGISDRRIPELGTSTVAVDLPADRPDELYVWTNAKYPPSGEKPR